jgi:hypothetical protein
MTLLLLAVAAGLGAAVTHWWHRTRTLAADAHHYRPGPAVTPPPEDTVGVTPARDIYFAADHDRRALKLAEARIVKLEGVIDALCGRLGDWRERARLGLHPNPNPFPRIRLFRWLP